MMFWLLTIAQGVLFIIWAGFMFHTLFAVRRIAAGENGSLNPGVSATLRAWHTWFTDPVSRPRALRLVWLTLALLGVIAINAMLIEVPA